MTDERLRPWRLRTPAQAVASRANGTKSRGPRTDEGKQAASQNARQHGLRAARIEDDERIWLRQFWVTLRAGLPPVAAAPMDAVE